MPAAVATADQQGYRPIDLLAVLTAVVRQHQQTLARLRKRLAALEAPRAQDGDGGGHGRPRHAPSGGIDPAETCMT